MDGLKLEFGVQIFQVVVCKHATNVMIWQLSINARKDVFRMIPAKHSTGHWKAKIRIIWKKLFARSTIQMSRQLHMEYLKYFANESPVVRKYQPNFKIKAYYISNYTNTLWYSNIIIIFNPQVEVSTTTATTTTTTTTEATTVTTTGNVLIFAIVI